MLGRTMSMMRDRNEIHGWVSDGHTLTAVDDAHGHLEPHARSMRSLVVHVLRIDRLDPHRFPSLRYGLVCEQVCAGDERPDDREHTV
jgi:hypothetical protein